MTALAGAGERRGQASILLDYRAPGEPSSCGLDGARSHGSFDTQVEWLGAPLRERPTGGIHRNRTMMAQLPPWMPSATARHHVVEALAALRARALREGFS